MSKKLVMVALVAVLTFGVSIAQATPSRVGTMGQGTGLLYIQDDVDIFYNPATIGYYRNCVLIHMGGSDGGDMYALGGYTQALGEMLTLGLVYGRNPAYELGMIGAAFIPGAAIDPAASPFSPMWAFNDNWGDYAGVNPVSIAAVAGLDEAMEWHNPIDIMVSAKLGNLLLGVSWYMARGKATATYTDDAPTDLTETLSAKLWALKVGLSADMGNIMPEIWFAYVPFTVNSKWEDDIVPTAEIERELKGRRFNLGMRMFVGMGDNLTIVPAIEWTNINGDVTIDTDPLFYPTTFITIEEDDLNENYKGSGINAGISFNYAMDRVLVVSSIGLQWSKITRELDVEGLSGSSTDELKWWALPVIGIGIEYQCTKILVFRAGISTTTINAAWTDTASDDEVGTLNAEDEIRITEQQTSASVGLGLHFGNLVIDLTVGDMILDGEESPDSLFSGLDVKYKFQ